MVEPEILPAVCSAKPARQHAFFCSAFHVRLTDYAFLAYKWRSLVSTISWHLEAVSCICPVRLSVVGCQEQKRNVYIERERKIDFSAQNPEFDFDVYVMCMQCALVRNAAC